MKVIVDIPEYMAGRLLCLISHYNGIDSKFTTDDVITACINREYERVLATKLSTDRKPE